MSRPEEMLKLDKDGDQWGVVWGDNLQEGVAAFGNTPAEAVEAFAAAVRATSCPFFSRAPGSRPHVVTLVYPPHTTAEIRAMAACDHVISDDLRPDEQERIALYLASKYVRGELL